MRHHKWISFAVAAALSSTLLAAVASANPALLFDLRDGRVIEQRDAFKRWFPASLTKLMTAYVTFKALEKGELKLDSPIKVTKKAAKQPPSKMGYKAGSVMNADNALKMMLVKSSNDIAMAIGENVGGSEKAFVERMNAEAQRLGMRDTHYVNPNGLHDVEQYTTARDQALLVSAIKREFPQYAHYFTIEGIVAGKKTLDNFNLLVGRYRGAEGMKTGFICPSGFNMIGAATRDGRSLVAIVFGEKTAVGRAETVAAMLDKGFASEMQPGETLTTLSAPADHTAAPVDQRDSICPKPKPGDKEAKAEPSENAEPEIKSPFQMPLDHAPTYVQVGLGNANGPTPTAMTDAAGNEYADVPIPEWRPDLPDPTLASVATQGDGALKDLRN
ncbi:MAG: D-alanyl-D-alanine carboxypeptidase family protein [Rhizobiaceae bacterium]